MHQPPNISPDMHGALKTGAKSRAAVVKMKFRYVVHICKKIEYNRGPHMLARIPQPLFTAIRHVLLWRIGKEMRGLNFRYAPAALFRRSFPEF